MRRSKVIVVRVSDDEHDQIRRWAEASGLTISDYLRGKAGPRLSVTSAGGASSVTWSAGRP